MRGFVDRDGEDHGQRVDQNGLNDVVEIHVALSQTNGNLCTFASAVEL